MALVKHGFTIAVQDFGGERYYSANRRQLEDLRQMSHHDRYKSIVVNHQKAAIHDSSKVDVHWVNSEACKNSGFVSEVNIALSPQVALPFTEEECNLILGAIVSLVSEHQNILDNYGPTPKDLGTAQHADLLARELNMAANIKDKLRTHY